MGIAWGKLWQAGRSRLRTGWLITAGLVAIYIGAIEPMNRYREVATPRGTGIAALAFEPDSMWHQMSPVGAMLQKGREAVAGNVSGIPARRESTGLEMLASDRLAGGGGVGYTEDRKTVRTASMDLTVKSPRDTSEKVRQPAERLGGFLVTSEINGG